MHTFLLKIIFTSITLLLTSSAQSFDQTNEPQLKIEDHFPSEFAVRNCSKTTFHCLVTSSSSSVYVWWTFGDETALPIESSRVIQASPNEWQLSLDCTTLKHAGTYTCHASTNETNEVVSKEAVIAVYVPVSIELPETNKIIYQNTGSRLELKCLGTSFPSATINWLRRISDDQNKTYLVDVQPNDRVNISDIQLNETTHRRSLIIDELSLDDNGTYLCRIQNEFDQREEELQLIVMSVKIPHVVIDRIETLTTHSVQLHWISVGNSEILNLTLHITSNSNPNQNPDLMAIENPLLNDTFTIDHLIPGVSYNFRLDAFTRTGSASTVSTINFTMPAEIPVQITEQKVLAITNETILVGWKRPPDNGAEIAEYHLELIKIKDSTVTSETINIRNSTQKFRKNYMYIFVGLVPATEYYFQVRACSLIGCGNWSHPRLKTVTGDGYADPPKNVKFTCYYDTSKNKNYAIVTWDFAENVRGTLLGHNVTFYGVSQFRNQENQIVTEHFSEWHYIKNNYTRELSAVVLTGNSNYTVTVCAVNLLGCGFASSTVNDSTRCSLQPSPPSILPNFTLQRSEVEGQLKLILPKVSERLGIITCYRLFIIKLPKGKRVSDLPADKSLLNVSSYSQAHSNLQNDHQISVYIADEVDNRDNYARQIIIGDGNFTTCERENSNYKDSQRQTGPSIWRNNVKSKSVSTTETQKIEDGPLFEQTNYSGFVEIRVLGSNNVLLRKTSAYFVPMQISSRMVQVSNSTNTVSPLLSSISNPTSTIILCLVSGFAFLLLVLLLILLIRRGFGAAQRSFHADEDGQIGISKEKKSDANHVVKSNGVVPPKQVNSRNSSKYATPIHVTDLLNVYGERRANDNNLFEAEFNSLPLEFQDRTANTCDLEVNREKNRFSSIKCYDLTRVCLSLIDQLQPNASDYINANFISINEKLYICTQGPLDSTVTDFWRMIYEYDCYVVLMLTNCEEQGRVKCVKYWPDEGLLTINSFLSVEFQSSKNYTDFVVRRFNLINSKNATQREILQFHFKKWSDFSAPEFPSRILRFIKHVNENYCQDKGPLVVHCCAGVGRSGTYIAVDSLLSEINSGFVNIYERVSNLRHQRYHMVQNSKQYIFIYRSLLEFALFADTEVDIDHFRDYYQQVFERDPNLGILKDQFNRLQIIIDEKKSFDYGMKQDNSSKNRLNQVVPYDYNRIMLLPNVNESSYINASLIKSYDTQLTFIVTQDPMESTVQDFWSMVYEENCCQIVMLSHVDSTQRQCYHYWPNEEWSLKNYSVKLVEETGFNNYFIKRRLQLTKHATVIESPHTVVMYQFLAWHSDHLIPESAIPLIILCEQVLSMASDLSSPIILHCHDGAQRSGICSSLLSLIYQIKVDKKVDVFQTVRCTALQRRGMFEYFDQYTFLYRSIMNYIKHRNLCDTSDVVL